MSNRKFQDLTIRNGFMFAAVMMRDDNSKKFLEMLLQIPLKEVVVSYEELLFILLFKEKPEYYSAKMYF